MKTELLDNECIIKTDSANLQINIETVGGHCTLTNKRIIFEPHAFNFQNKVVIIYLDTIKKVESSWTKFLNIVPIYPNSLSITDDNNKIFKFVLFNRDKWAKEIKNVSINIQ